MSMYSRPLVADCALCTERKPMEQMVSQTDEAHYIPVTSESLLDELTLNVSTTLHGVTMGPVGMQITGRPERQPKNLNICYDCMVEKVLPSVFSQLHTVRSCPAKTKQTAAV